jgi:hypothetical protein
MATVAESELYETRREAEVFRILKEWCREDSSNRTAELHINGGSSPTRILKDRTVKHGCGHNYAGMGTGFTLRDAIDKAFECAKRWEEKSHA